MSAGSRWCLCGMLALGAAISLSNLLRTKSSERNAYAFNRESNIGHLLMNASMAMMLTPWYGEGLRASFTLLYTAIAVASAALLVLEKRFAGRYGPAAHQVRMGTFGFHVIASVAMIYVLETTGGMGMRGMSMAGAVVQQTPRFPALLWLISAIFLLDAVVTFVLVVLLPGKLPMFLAGLEPEPGNGGQLRDYGGIVAVPGIRRPGDPLLLEAAPHLIMDAGMVVMMLSLL